MESFAVLTKALDYIENNLSEEISQKEIADHCSYSLSALQKMFRRVFHIGIADYIARRRITAASRDLLNTDDNILDIALRYGYNSHEVFSRKFTRIWGESPSQYRKKRSFSEIYPRLDMPITISGGHTMKKFRFDLTGLYETLREMHDTYAICFDMCNLLIFNEKYGHDAGDIAIAECLKRIDSVKEEDMIMFRIGGDEFVLLTNKKELEDAEALRDRVFSHNNETVTYNGEELPVSLHGGIIRLDTARGLRYSKLFTDLVEAGRNS
ncbi:MAG: helix-turn-helix domain-containing protein [Ruminiclostridium sp.]|nr:helix-turn-helix domain-containing protein [Ruminococcus sp.]MBQ8613845.1 helix-turn-helix domain-containing protein [Ruminiclostridium sp.]